MKLLFLYGAPAVGKLTIARQVANATGWPLFDNHLTVDLVLAIYPFGSPGFVALRETIWTAVFRRAMQDRLPGVIFTFNPERSVPQRFIDDLFAEIARAGGDVIPVELTASEAEIERRLGAPSRHEKRKLVDLELYRRLRDAGEFTAPVIRWPRLSLDTDVLSPGEAAAKIAALVGVAVR